MSKNKRNIRMQDTYFIFGCSQRTINTCGDQIHDTVVSIFQFQFDNGRKIPNFRFPIQLSIVINVLIIQRVGEFYFDHLSLQIRVYS